MNSISAIMFAAALAAAGSATAGDYAAPYVGGNAGANNAGASGLYSTSPATAPWYSLESGYGYGLNFGSNVTAGVQGSVGAFGSNVMLGVQGSVGTFGDTTHASGRNFGASFGGNAYGLGLKVGVPIDSLMPYAWLGYDHAQGTGALSGFSADSANSGVGLMYKFAPSWSMEGAVSSSIPSAGGIRLKSNSVNFGLNYHFDSPPATSDRRR